MPDETLRNRVDDRFGFWSIGDPIEGTNLIGINTSTGGGQPIGSAPPLLAGAMIREHNHVQHALIMALGVLASKSREGIEDFWTMAVR